MRWPTEMGGKHHCDGDVEVGIKVDANPLARELAGACVEEAVERDEVADLREQLR